MRVNRPILLWTVLMKGWFLKILVTVFLLVSRAAKTQANIYEWTYDSIYNVIQSSTVCPGGTGVSAVPSANLSHLDLTQAYLIRADLTEVNLNSTTLTNANLTNSRLTNANLTNANVAGTIFDGSNLTASQLYSTANYQACNLSGVIIRWNDLTGWNFVGQNLTSASFDFATLTNANLTGATLAYADLEFTTLTNANLENANVARAYLGYSNLTASQLYSTASYQASDLKGISLMNNNLTGWNFAGQNLTNAELMNVTLTNANLTSADMTSALLDFATLTNANLTSAKLCSADLNSVTLTSASLTTVNLTNANLFAATLTNANLTGANLTGAYLYAATLTDANLINANLNSANLTAADLRGAQSIVLGSATVTNTILRDGTIQGLHLTSNNDIFLVRNYSGHSIHILQGMSMDTGTSLAFQFDSAPWGSTISFDSGVLVTLGGNLELDVMDGVKPVSLYDSFQLFNWTGVSPQGQFAKVIDSLPAGYSWDTSQLYTLGVVTLVPEPSALITLCISFITLLAYGRLRRGIKGGIKGSELGIKGSRD
jgi:uncharacterized protein YjbI with pentapeptide repeats